MPVGVYPRPSTKERLEKYTLKLSCGCWIWIGYTDKGGYGVSWDGQRKMQAHRLSYQLHKNRIISEGLQLDHLCRNRSCVNPDHLEEVTNQENCRRGLTGIASGQKQKNKTHCSKGHPFSDKNTTYEKNGKRHCKICKYNCNYQGKYGTDAPNYLIKRFL